MSSKIGRRTFIGSVGAAAGTAVLVDPFTGQEAEAASSNVYSGHHTDLVSGSTPSTVQENWVQAALDACVKAMTGKSSVGAAWEAIFSGVTTSSKVAIKINCLKKEVSPQLATIKALVKGMTQMKGGAFPAKNISLFDNTMPFSGLSGSNRMAAVYGSQNLSALGITFADPSPQYASATFQVRGKSYHPAAYLAQADFGISLVPLKPHQYYGGGITGVIKNMMGACSTSTSSYAGGSNFHDKAPYQSFVDAFKNYMKANLHLYVADMLFAAKTENASGWSKLVERITISKDPCAMDAYFADVLNSVSLPGTKAVPQALASAGLGNATYNLVEPTVTLGGTPTVPTRDVLDKKIRDHRGGKATDSDVKALIKQYRGQ
jgi:hypothetical protein